MAYIQISEIACMIVIISSWYLSKVGRSAPSSSHSPSRFGCEDDQVSPGEKGKEKYKDFWLNLDLGVKMLIQSL